MSHKKKKNSNVDGNITTNTVFCLFANKKHLRVKLPPPLCADDLPAPSSQLRILITSWSGDKKLLQTFQSARDKLSKSQTEAPAGGLKQNTQSVDLRCFISRPRALYVVNKHVFCLRKKKKGDWERPHVSETKALGFFPLLGSTSCKDQTLCFFPSSKCDSEIFQSVAPEPPQIIPPVTVRKLLDWPSPPARGTQHS